MTNTEARCRQYRCYLIHRGRIARAEELAATSLADAVAQGRGLLAADADTVDGSGIEIWEQGEIRHSDRCHAADTGQPVPIYSPFETAECTMMPRSRRSLSRSLAILTFV